MCHFGRHFVLRGSDERLRVLVIGHTGHARIAVIQEMHARQPQLLGGAAQLGLSPLGDRGIAPQMSLVHITSFAARGAHQVHCHAAPGV